MDKGKGVRKYGRLRQGLRWGRYFAHKSVVVPVALVAVLVTFVAGFACVVGFLGAVLALLFTLIFGNRGIDFWPFVISCLLFMPVSGGIAVVSGIFFCRFLDAPVGNVLNPAHPTENPLLPDAELLVRPSSSSAAQPAELLRAAKETTEEKPEELLRAGTERQA